MSGAEVSDTVAARTSREASASARRVGGVCLVGAGAVYAVSAVLSVIIAAPPSAAEVYLRSVSQHLAVSGANFGLWVLSDVLLLPAALALYLSLKPLGRRLAMAGCALLALFAVFDAVFTERYSLRLVLDAARYTKAASAAQRLSVVAARNTLAVLPAATFVSYAVSSLGLLLVSVVMLRGFFTKVTAYAGIIASIEGLVGGLYPLVPALALLLVPSLVAFAVWALLAGRRLLPPKGSAVEAVARSA